MSLSDLHSSFIRCRSYGHAWDDFYPSMATDPSWGVRESLLCARCTTERHDFVSRITGEVITRYYLYPDDYKLSGEFPQRSEIRKELIARLDSGLRGRSGDAVLSGTREFHSKKIRKD